MYKEMQDENMLVRTAVCSVLYRCKLSEFRAGLKSQASNGEEGVSRPITEKETSRLTRVSLNSMCTLLYTHTYCAAVSAATDWGLTIHRKVNKLLSVLCRGLHCPLASHPTTMLHITLTKVLEYCNFPKPQSWIYVWKCWLILSE